MCCPVNVNQGQRTKQCTVFRGGAHLSDYDNIIECGGYEKNCNHKKVQNMQCFGKLISIT